MDGSKAQRIQKTERELCLKEMQTSYICSGPTCISQMEPSLAKAPKLRRQRAFSQKEYVTLNCIVCGKQSSDFFILY